MLPFTMNSIRRTSVASRAINVWNDLPSDFVNIVEPELFRNKLETLAGNTILPVSLFRN